MRPDEHMLVSLFHLHLEEWMAKCNCGMPMSQEEMEWLNERLLGLEEGRSPVCTNAFNKMMHLMTIVESTFNTYYYDPSCVVVGVDGCSERAPVVKALRRFRMSLYERQPAIRKVLDEKRRVQYAMEEVMHGYGLTWEQYTEGRPMPCADNLYLPKDRMDSQEYERKLTGYQKEYLRLLEAVEKSENGSKQQMEILKRKLDVAFGAYYHLAEKVNPMDAVQFRKSLAPLLRRSVALTAELKLLKIRFKYEDGC